MKDSVKFLMAVLLLGTCLWAIPASAGQQFQPISQSELQMTSEPLAPGAPAIILQRQVDRDDRDRYVSHEDNYLRIKILTEEGRKYANVELPLYSGVDKVENLQARTIRPDGSVVNFDGTVYGKVVVKARGLKVQLKAFTLPDVQVGSIFEYFYTINLKGSFDSHWAISSNLFTKRAQFSFRPFAGSFVPLRLRIVSRLMSRETQPQQGPDHVTRLEVSNIPAFEVEDFMPPENELKASVDFIYELSSGGSDPDKFWKTTGKTWNDALESFLRRHKTVEEAVGKIASPGDPPEERLRKIYARVQLLRNTSYEIQRTEKEQKRNEEKPVESVDDVWKHGYGDSVQLAWLFLGLVRAAGFEAYGCWVASRAEHFFNPKLMQTAGLNSNIVLVKIAGKEIYLDPGVPFAPFGVLPWNEAATPGIRLDNDGGTWIRPPLPPSSVSQLQRSARFKLSEAGSLEGKVTMTYSGLDAMYQRLDARNEDDVARKQRLENQLKAQIPTAAEVELTKQPDWKSSETPLQAEFTVKILNWASSTGRRLLFPVGIFSEYEKGMFVAADRIHPVYFTYPYSERDDVGIELPPTWRAPSLPPAQEQRGNNVLYSMNIGDTPGALHITRQFNVDLSLLDQPEYSGLHRFFQSVRSNDEQQIVLQAPAARDR